MAKTSSEYVCQQCGATARRWMGRCEACGSWNSLVEELAAGAVRGRAGAGRRIALTDLAATSDQAHRIDSGIGEFDRVCGGGLVPGSALLIGGDPGIGKSTLLLQITARLAAHGIACAYVTGEEAIDQVRLRADRLGLAEAPLALAFATSVRDIAATFDVPDAPQVVVIDSIQTMFVETLESAPGTVAQVRSSAQELIRVAKRRGLALVLVGHVTKEGTDRRAARAGAHGRQPCSTSRASAATSSGSCARSRTGSGPPTRSACST